MSMLLAAFALFGGIAIGVYGYVNHSGGADATYDAFATISSAFWVLSGVLLILGGFELGGMVVLALFTYVGLTKGAKTGKRLRARIAD